MSNSHATAFQGVYNTKKILIFISVSFNLNKDKVIGAIFLPPLDIYAIMNNYLEPLDPCTLKLVNFKK
jgi:hypothetical protein